jgi:BirA family transcriptional regulator, biotin operon repressor / biotin---[acetyl-CoA-carboxylase] ligase
MNLVIHDELGSTSDEARRQAQDGAPHGIVIAARCQTAGRGRQGRTWVSPAGNLHASLLLRPEIAAARVPEIGFVAALAVADTVDAVLPGGPAAGLKWPNDVQLLGAKVAGILVELVEDGAVIAGIGVNVAHTPPDMPYPVTCLAAHGCQTAMEGVLQALIAAFERHWLAWSTAGFDPVRDAWLRRGPPLGQVLQVRSGQQGRFAGLDADGALLLETADGTRRVVAGEVA